MDSQPDTKCAHQSSFLWNHFADFRHGRLLQKIPSETGCRSTIRLAKSHDESKSFLLLTRSLSLADRYRDQAISELIEERRHEAYNPDKNDVLQHMLDNGNRPDTGIRMSDQDIIDQMSELLLAGSETTSGKSTFLTLLTHESNKTKRHPWMSLPRARQKPSRQTKAPRLAASSRSG